MVYSGVRGVFLYSRGFTGVEKACMHAQRREEGILCVGVLLWGGFDKNSTKAKKTYKLTKIYLLRSSCCLVLIHVKSVC